MDYDDDYYYSQILEVNVSPNIQVASKLLIYRKTLTKTKNQNSFIVVRRNDKRIIQIYEYDGFFQMYGDELIEQQKSRMKKQTGLKSIDIVDFVAFDSLIGNYNIYLLKNEGILIKYQQNLYYDRWNLPGEKITRIVGLIDKNILAAITDKYVYFVTIQTNQNNDHVIARPIIKEIARVELKGPNFIEAFNIGEFLILADNQTWNVFYLKEGKENSIKSFSFSTPLLMKDIAIDGFSSLNSFFVKNQQFVLRKPSLNIGPNTSSTVILKTADCEHSISIKRFGSKQVEAVSDNKGLVWRNGILQTTYAFCQGNNVSSTFIINEQAVTLPRLNLFRPNLPIGATQILNFTMITQDLAAIVVSAGNKAIILSCYRNEPCISHKYVGFDTQQIEFRLYTFDVRIPKRELYQWRQQRQEKQLLVIVVKDMGISQWNHFNVDQNSMQLVDEGHSRLSSYKFTDFEVIDYSPKKTGCNTQPFFEVHFVIYLEFSIINRWSHLTTFTVRHTEGFEIKQNSDDIMSSFKQMCSIYNSNLKFMLYEYQDNTLKIQLFQEKVDFYHEIGSVAFDNLQSKRAVCSKMGLAVTNGSEIFFVSEDLVVTRTLKLTSSTEGDKMSGNLLLHSIGASTTEIYNAETGFLIQSLRVPLTQIVTTKQQNSFALKNGTIFRFEQTASLALFHPESFALLACFNTHSSVSKIKNIRIIDDLSLPETIEPSSLATIDKNVWNATVRSLKGVTSLAQTQSLTHFTTKPWQPFPPVINSLGYLNRYQFLRQILGEYIQILKVVDYCVRQAESITYRADTFFGLTLFRNRLTIAYWNESIISFQNYQLDEKSPLNVTKYYKNSCYVGVWVEEQFYLTRRMFRDSDHVYLMRYQIGLWNSSYIISEGQDKTLADKPRRLVVEKPKIQIFTLEENGGCEIQEITSESLGKDEEIKDFATYVRDGTTFVFILTNTQVIAFKTLDQKARFSAQLDRPFAKIDVRFDMLLLVSTQDDSVIYNILWQAFPFAGTLQQNFTLVHVQESSDIVGGVIMEQGVVIAFSKSLILYAFEAKSAIYSIETKAAFELSADLKLIDAIEYKDSKTIVLQCFIDWFYKTVEVAVSFSLDAGRFEKLVVGNEQESKEYERGPALRGAEDEKSLTTE